MTLREHRYGLVLTLILASLVFQLAAPDEAWARLVIIALQGLTLLSALHTSAIHRGVLNAVAVAVSIAIAGAVVGAIGGGGIGPTPARIESLLLVALAPVAIARGIARHFRESGRVTVNTMFGVLCIYLLVGMLFGFGFSVIDQLDGQRFFALGASRPADFLYFSFATLTTVGYGDLAAATDVGRSLAIAEALIGQIYMVTVVAVIVGNLGRAGPRANDPA
jgi:hypothetical protein